MKKLANGVEIEMSAEEEAEFLASLEEIATIEDVGRERYRRLGLGFSYDFGDDRGVHRFGTTDKDMQGWDEVTQFKDVLIQLGDTTTKIKIVTETGPCEVTAPEWNAVLAYAAEHFRQPLWQASFVLQAMNPIPTDYATNAAYWPAAS